MTLAEFISLPQAQRDQIAGGSTRNLLSSVPEWAQNLGPEYWWMLDRGTDYGPDAPTPIPRTSGGDEGGSAIAGYRFANGAQLGENFDPVTGTYWQPVSTPEETQAMQQFDLRGNPVGPAMVKTYGSSGTLDTVESKPWAPGLNGLSIHTSSSPTMELAAIPLAAAGAHLLSGAANTAATAADMAGGMMPQFGTTATYNAGIGLGNAALTPEYLAAADAAGGLLPEYGTTAAYSAATGLPPLPGYSTLKDTLQATAAGKALFQGQGGTNDKGSSIPASDRLARILRGEGTLQDLLDVGGAVAPAALGAYASNQQSSTIRELANRARADRAPFLNAANQWLTNPQSFYEGPGAEALKANLHKLSATHGNPFGSPNAMALATEAAMRDWRSAVTGFANIGLGGEGTQANLGLRGVEADGNAWSALGAGAAELGDIFRPKRRLADILDEHLKGGKGLGMSAFGLT